MARSRTKSAVAARRRRRLETLLRRERELWKEGYDCVAGIDEAGVGPLAGPVVAAAVVFPRGQGVKGVDDSKRISPEQRGELAIQIRASSTCWAVAVVEHDEIDRLNIYRAGLEAMRRALESLTVGPDYVLVDGRAVLFTEIPQEKIVGGDASCHAIAAASILAKTERDAIMSKLDESYPGYGFAEHKGYATASHRDAIRRLGPSPIHRRSFTLLPHPRLWE